MEELPKLNLGLTNNELLNDALDEEESRRIVSVAETDILWQYFVDSAEKQNLYTLQQLVTAELPELITQAEQTNYLLSQKTYNEESYQLKTNKNLELFQYILQLLTQNPNFLQDLYTKGFKYVAPNGKPINIGKIVDFDNPDDNLGNSYLSAVNVILLLCLSNIKQKSITKLIEEDLAEINIGMIDEFSQTVEILQLGIFQHDESPNIQRCYINDSKLRDIKNPLITQEPSNPGLYTHSGGYAFGGSDPVYTNKTHRFEDCSSAASKWLELPRFSTADLQQYYENPNIANQEGQDIFVYKEMAKKLDLVQKIEDVKVGDIICWRTLNPETGNYIGGHVGVITETKLPEIGLMSYSRDIPTKDGIGNMKIDISDQSTNRKFMFFKVKAKNFEKQQ